MLDHKHHEDLFDDFARQPLLPNRLSQLGPGVAWFDLNGDGREELIIGSGKGGRLAIYQNDPHKGLILDSATASGEAATRDQTTVLGSCREGIRNPLRPASFKITTANFSWIKRTAGR